MLPSLSDSYFIYRGSLLGREVLYTYPSFDPDFEYFKIQKIQAVGTYYRELSNLDKWVGIASTTGMSLEEWFTHDQYWQEAIYQAVADVVEARNKKEQEREDKLLGAAKESRETSPYISPFATVPKPTFQMG